VYTRSLLTSGCRVIAAATTVLAYQIATTQPTGMVVTESHSPGSMSGLELTRRLRIHTRTVNVPIIVLTRGTRPQDAELSIKAGADMFLETPVSGEVLREHVVRLLVACGRQSPADVNASAGDNRRHLAYDRTCPECRGALEYRWKTPILTVPDPDAREPQERLRYVSGWFCRNAACEYRDLAARTE